MKWLALPLLAAAAAVGGPAALKQSSPGLWELRKVPDGKPMRECIADVAALAQIEHSAGPCARNPISSDATGAVFRYSCPAGDFGQSKLTVVTPRALTIETQGISGGLPFNYVVHARRIGNCPTV